MSLSVCAMSGQPLTHAVLSKKTGHVFEKAIIEKHLNSFPYCPITNNPLTHADLIDIIPNSQRIVRQEESPTCYLKKLENEYTMIAIESFRLRRGLKEAKEQLTSCLSENEAASQVIARLLKEKEDAEGEIARLAAKLQGLK